MSPFAFQPRKVDKPWGYELIWAHADEYVGKVLFVRAGCALSLQYHHFKDETWYFQAGKAAVELSGLTDETPHELVVEPGAAFHLRPGTVHRLVALEDTTVLEVSTPFLDDIVRLDDLYGRADRVEA
jgi:mannose-6-phosphate isomerase-like protein (cupin superfamily)